MSKNLPITIDQPWWGAWKKFGWSQPTWGIGIKKSKVEAAIVAGYDYFEVSTNKAKYLIKPGDVEKYAMTHDTMHKAKQGVILYVVPETELVLVEDNQPKG